MVDGSLARKAELECIEYKRKEEEAKVARENTGRMKGGFTGFAKGKGKILGVGKEEMEMGGEEGPRSAVNTPARGNSDDEAEDDDDDEKTVKALDG